MTKKRKRKRKKDPDLHDAKIVSIRQIAGVH